MESCFIRLVAVLIVVCSTTGESVLPVDPVFPVDPCTSFEPLPRAEYRGGLCEYVQDKAVCDVYLDSDVWYRAEGLNGYLTMQNSTADFGFCGTKFPIWMNGAHPTVQDGEVDRQGCQANLGDSCSTSVNIKVKNCGSFHVYKMPQTGSCPEGYCFGETDPCPPFNPCDAYEHSTITYDSTRSTSCGISDVSICDDTLTSDTWYKFSGETSNEYLTVASSCPSDTTCGAQYPLWISGTVEDYPNGTSLNSVCGKSGDDCCAQAFNIQSKVCSGFTVYHFTEEVTGQCQRYCTDDSSSACRITTPAPIDPCTTNELLPRAEYRGGQCAYVTDKAVCDVYLNANTWYRAEGLDGYLTMQETPADFLTCGTKFPIWMNGTHPTMADGEVDRQGCQTDLYSFCNDPVTIKVKNCGSFYVYKMPRTGSCPEAYCFGGSDPCPPFDPCDYYENTAIPHDASRSTSCSGFDEPLICDNIASGSWYKFRGKANNEYLTVANTCPTSKSTCATDSQLWVNGIAADYPNGTRSSYACVKRGEECCDEIFELQSKQCAAGFTVYHFNQDLTGPCFGFCTEDTTATCPVTPRPTVTEPPGNQDHKDKSLFAWLVPLLFGVMIVGGGIGAVVTYVVFKIKRRERVGSKYEMQDPQPYYMNTPPAYTTGLTKPTFPDVTD